MSHLARIGTYYRDCARRVAPAFGGVYCDRCLLGTFHSKRHKCSREAFDPSRPSNAAHVQDGDNSQVVEQIWSEIESTKCTDLATPRYRCLVSHFCLWGNRQYDIVLVFMIYMAVGAASSGA